MFPDSCVHQKNAAKERNMQSQCWSSFVVPTDFKIKITRITNRKKKRKEKTWAVLTECTRGMATAVRCACFVRPSVRLHRKQNSPTEMDFLKSKSNFPIHKQHNQIAFVCSALISSRLLTINAVVGTLCFFRSPVDECLWAEQKKFCFWQRDCKVPSPSVKTFHFNRRTLPPR